MHLFLSYRSPDRSLAEALAARLAAQGVDCFLAPWSLRPGAFWLPALAQAIAAADAFVLLLGKGRAGPWQLVEYYEAFDRKARDPAFPIVPLIVPGADARLPFLRQLHWVETGDPASADAVRSLLSLLAEPPSRAQDTLWRALNPYRGLNALGEEDADFFFGREEPVRAAVDRLAAGSRCVLLIGNSGVGKSSLMDAGIVAALRRQQLPGAAPWPAALRGSRRWLFLPLRLGTNPLLALARAFVSAWTEPEDPARATLAESWAQTLRGQELSAILAATRDVFRERLAMDPPERFVLVLNQGEELYRARRAEESTRFSSLLGNALDSPNLTLLGSLRSDHYGRLQDDHELFSRSARVDVEPLRTAAQLLPVIERPAAALAVRFDPATAPADIAGEAARTPGGLPLLCYLLEEMWRRMQQRGDGVLRWEDYSTLGHVEGVLGERLEAYLAGQRERTLDVQRLMTLRLARVARGREISRREGHRDECSPAEWEHVETLAGAEWRLIVTGNEGGRSSAEVAHEAVLRAEGPVVRWIRDDSQFLEWKARLEEERRLWADNGESDEWLLKSGRLKQFQRQIGKRRDDLAPADREYLERSERHAPESRRRARRLVVAAALLAASLAAALTFLWLQGRVRRQEQAKRALVECGAQVRSLPDGSTEVSFNPVSQFNPRCLRRLAAVKDLRSVDLSQVSLGPDDLRPLSGLGELTQLDLASTGISDAGLRWLAPLHHLRDLDLSFCPVHFASILAMPEPKRFQSLRLQQVALGSEPLDGLESFSELRTLSLMQTGIGDRELESVGRLPHLEELDLEANHRITGRGLSHLAGLGALRRLYLSDTQIDDQGLSLAQLPATIEDLNLDNCRLHGTTIGQLARLPRLRVLELSYNPLQRGFASRLRSLEKLESLWLKEAGLADADLETIGTFRGLRTLSVPSNDLSDSGFAHLAKLPGLEELYAGGTGFGDASLQLLARIPSLRFLRIPNTKVSLPGLQRLRRSSPPALRVLVQTGAFTTDELQRAGSTFLSIEEIN